MRRKLLYIWLFITIVFGRELYEITLPIDGLKLNHFFHALMLVFFIPDFLRLKVAHKLIWTCILLLTIVATINGYIQGNLGVYFNLNYPIGLLFYVVGYSWFDKVKSYRLLLDYFTILFFITYLFKEFQFILGGTPLLFGFSEIRETRDIAGLHLVKGSSDSIITIGNIVLIWSLSKRRITHYIVFILAAWILIRYGVRTTFGSIILAYIVYNIWNNWKVERMLSYAMISILLLSISTIDLEQFFETVIRYIRDYGLDKRETFIWRLASWFDVITTAFKDGLYLFGESGRNIQYSLLTKLDMREYLNPHNSYIYLLLHFGLLNLILMFFLVFKVLHTDMWYYPRSIIRISSIIVLMYCIYPNGSPLQELIYQGPILWFLVGSHAKLKKINLLSEQSKDHSSVTHGKLNIIPG